eukprot:GEMP01002152.1.p1 GENE.GEMP01002152.1~~GEMP01002152.1.p1  ORF type:complete len:1074 (+),score=335.57 GEMP01002152.1:101-3322(+)
MEDVDEASCPLCMEVLDPTDQAFFPCPCRYQVCLWCVHHIREQMNGTCPACRQEYLDENFITDETIKEEALNKAKEKEKEAKEAALKAEQEAAAAAAAGKGPSKADREKQRKKREKLSELATVRIVQRNVIYVMGIAPSIAKAEVLRRPEFFGQYGTLLKVSVNRSAYVSYHQRRGSGSEKTAPATYAAYLTYATDDDAKSAKDSVDGFEVDGSALRVCFGTTRYCQSFLKDIKCVKPDCTFLHAIVENRKKRGGQRVRERERERADRAQQRERAGSDQNYSQQNTWNNDQQRDRSAPSSDRRGGKSDRGGSNRGRSGSGPPLNMQRELSKGQQQYRPAEAGPSPPEQDVGPAQTPPTAPPPAVPLSQIHPPTVPPPAMEDASRTRQPALPPTVPPPLVDPSAPVRKLGLAASLTAASASGRVQKRSSMELRELIPPAIPPPEKTIATRAVPLTESAPHRLSLELRNLTPPPMPPPPIPRSPRLPTTVPKDGPPPPDFAPPPIPAMAATCAESSPAVEQASCDVPTAGENEGAAHDLVTRPPSDVPSLGPDFSLMMTLFGNAHSAGEDNPRDIPPFVAPEHFYDDFLPYSRVDTAVAPIVGETTTPLCDQPMIPGATDSAAAVCATSFTERPLGTSSIGGSLYAPLATQSHVGTTGWNDAAVPPSMNAEPSSPLLPQVVLDPTTAAAAARKRRNKDKGAPLSTSATNGQQQQKGSKGSQQLASKQQPKGQRKQQQAAMAQTPPDYGAYAPHLNPYTQQPNYAMYNGAVRDSWSPQHPQAEQQNDRRRRNKKSAQPEWKPVLNNCSSSTDWAPSLNVVPSTTSPHDWNAPHDWKAPMSPSAMITTPSSGTTPAGGWKTPMSEWKPDLSSAAAASYPHWSDPWAPTALHNAGVGGDYPLGISSGMPPENGPPRHGMQAQASGTPSQSKQAQASGTPSPSKQAQASQGAAHHYDDNTYHNSGARGNPWDMWPETGALGENGDGSGGNASGIHSQGIDLLQSIFPNTKVSIAVDDWKPSVTDPKYDNDGNPAQMQPNGDGSAPVTRRSTSRTATEFSQVDQAKLYYGTPFSPDHHRV